MMLKLRVAALVVLAIAPLGCGDQQQSAPAEGTKLRVVATTTIVADVVRAVAGDQVQLESLMGPGVDPHLYKPSAGDVRRIRRPSWCLLLKIVCDCSKSGDRWG